MPDDFTKEQMVGLLRSAVVLVTTTTPMSEKLHRLLDQYPGLAGRAPLRMADRHGGGEPLGQGS